MKKILFITGVLCLFAASSVAQKRLEQDIRGRSCSGGLGRCIKDIGTGLTFDVTKLSSTTFFMEIELAKLSTEEQLICFGKEYAKIQPGEVLQFAQNDPYVFDKDTLLYMDLDPGFAALEVGKYPMEIINGKVRITLSLSKIKTTGI